MQGFLVAFLGLPTVLLAFQETNTKILTNESNMEISTAWGQCQIPGLVIEGARSAALLADLSSIPHVAGCRLNRCNETDKFDAHSAEECAQICSTVNRCEWWVFGRDEATQKCWLRQAAGETLRNQDGFVAGQRSCTPPPFPSCVSKGVIIKQQALMTDLSRFGVSAGCMKAAADQDGNCSYTDKFAAVDSAECARMCQAVTGCQWWTFHQENGEHKCWLKAGGGTRSEVPDGHAGARWCAPNPPVDKPSAEVRSRRKTLLVRGTSRLDARVGAQPLSAPLLTSVPWCAQQDTLYINNMGNAAHKATAQGCQEYCRNTPGCLHFTFQIQKGLGNGSQNCKLQGANAIVTYMPGAVAGPPRCTGSQKLNRQARIGGATPSCVKPGYHYEPLDMPGYNHSMELDASVCQRRCAKSRGCVSFTFQLNGQCHLAGAGAIIKKSGGSLVGPARCEEIRGLPVLSRSIAQPLAVVLEDEKQVSGRLSDAAVHDVPCQQIHKALNPLDMPNQERSVEASASDCQARCARVRGCAFFSFWADGGCHITTASGVMVDLPHEDVLAGPVRCVEVSGQALPGSSPAGNQKAEDSEEAGDAAIGSSPGHLANASQGPNPTQPWGNADSSKEKVLFADIRGPSRLTGDGVRSMGMIMDLQEACGVDVHVLTDAANSTVLRQDWSREVSSDIMGKMSFLNPAQYSSMGKFKQYDRIIIGAKMELLYSDGRGGIAARLIQDLLEDEDGDELREKVSVFWDDVPFQRCLFRQEADEICPQTLPLMRRLVKVAHKFYVLTEKDRDAMQAYIKDREFRRMPHIHLWPMRLENMARCLPGQRFHPSFMRHGVHKKFKQSHEGTGQTLITMMGNHHVVNKRMTQIMFYSGAVHKICHAIEHSGSDVKVVFAGQLTQEVVPMVEELNTTSNLGCVEIREGFIPEEELVNDILSKTRAFLNPFFFDVKSGISVKTYEAVMSGTPFVTSEFGMHGLTDEIERCQGFPMPRDPTSTDEFADFVIDNVVNDRGYRSFSAAFRNQAQACREHQGQVYPRDRVCLA